MTGGLSAASCAALADVPQGAVRFDGARAPHAAETEGRGVVQVCEVLPGVRAGLHAFEAPRIVFRHAAEERVLEVYHCRGGRIGWNMRGGTAVYLGAGDLTVHSSACCADSEMMFPLGWAEGFSAAVDLDALAAAPPEALRLAGVDCAALAARYAAGAPTVLRADELPEAMFATLYAAPAAQRPAYLRLKMQELLLTLAALPERRAETAPLLSAQAACVREVHDLLTAHLDERFTIEELSRRFLLNTSTLKQAFKAVYGQPIAAYMKEYRVRHAMRLLRESDDTVADIAAQMGYGTQGKFAKAFQDVTGQRPSDYRRQSRG